MQVICEIGSGWVRDQYPVEDAIKAAFDCGADFVKIQWWQNGKKLSMRRGGVVELEPWSLSASELLSLIEKFPRKTLGASVFDPGDIGDLCHLSAFGKDAVSRLGFLKVATQEHRYASLVERASSFSAAHRIPIFVSIPNDGCLTMGDYSSPLPITWLQCVPYYPAAVAAYDPFRIGQMRDRLPGHFGISDHTAGLGLIRKWAKGIERTTYDPLTDQADAEIMNIDVAEVHFCYHAALRGLVPDGGPWSLSPADFKKYVEVAHGSH